MFTVYGVTGQVFNGTLEEMSRVNGLERTRTTRTSDREEDNWQLGVPNAESSGPSQKAVRAYRAMLPREIERGPLYHAGQIMRHRVISAASARARNWGVIKPRLA